MGFEPDEEISTDVGLKVIDDAFALFDPLLETTIAIDFVVLPSCAVTRMLMVVVAGYVLRAIAPDAVPLVTTTPFTVIIALRSAAVGVTVKEVIVGLTDVV